MLQNYMLLTSFFSSVSNLSTVQKRNVTCILIMLIILLRPFSMIGGLCTSIVPRLLRSVDTAEDADVHLFGTMHWFTIGHQTWKWLELFQRSKGFLKMNLYINLSTAQERNVTRILLMSIILLRPFSMIDGLCTSIGPRFLRSVDTAEDADVRLDGTIQRLLHTWTSSLGTFFQLL